MEFPAACGFLKNMSPEDCVNVLVKVGAITVREAVRKKRYMKIRRLRKEVTQMQAQLPYRQSDYFFFHELKDKQAELSELIKVALADTEANDSWHQEGF